MEHVTLRLTWNLKAEHAPLLLAAEKGFFAAEGLEVEIAEGDDVNTTLDHVADGKEVVAFGSAEAAIRAIDRNRPLQVIAVYGRTVPWAIVARPGVVLRSAKDLAGHTLAIAKEGTFEPILRAWAAREGVDLRHVTLVPLNEEDKAAQFMSGKVDLAAVYTNNQVPVWEHQTGTKLAVLRLFESGLQVPGTALISSRKFAQEHSALLQKLVRGINGGYAYATRHVDEAAAVVSGHLSGKTDVNVIKSQIRQTIELLPDSAGGKPSGRLSDANWQQALDLLHESGLIKQRQPLQAYYDSGLIK
ncbi:MAG TPA: ABC transporter substrate-binding protein [Symbiobacteriaceae bacterium]